MHQHIAHPPGPEPTPGIIDNISDTLLNAFSRVRKPDERFLSMRENVDKFEEGLLLSERLWTRVRSRTNGERHFDYLPLYCIPEYLRLIYEMEMSNLEKI
jgi:sorting nexin-4